MKLSKRDGMWHMLFKDGDRWRRLSTGVPSTEAESEATKAATEKLRAALVKGDIALAPQAARSIGTIVNLAEALEATYQSRWKNSASDVQLKYVVPRLQREIGHWLLKEIDYNRLLNYRDDLLKGPKPKSPATVNRRMSLLKTALREAARRNGTFAPEFPETLNEENVCERYFSEAEEAQILAWMGGKAAAETLDPQGTGEWEFMAALSALLLDVGGRITETLHLGAPQDNAAVFVGMLKDRKTRVVKRRTKSAKTRRVPLTPRAARAFIVFLSSPFYGKVDVAWVEHRWDLMRVDLKLEEPANPHISRHTFASRLLERGVDIYTVSKLLGHSSVKVTERYAALVRHSIFEQAIARLAGGPIGIVSDTGTIDNTQLSRFRK